MLALAREALLSETLAPAWTVRCLVGPGISYTGRDATQTLRHGFRAKGAAWLRQELAKKTVTQLRELAGAAGTLQRSGASTRNREELLDALSQCISEQEASWGKRLFCALCSWFPSSLRFVRHMVCVPTQVGVMLLVAWSLLFLGSKFKRRVRSVS